MKEKVEKVVVCSKGRRRWRKFGRGRGWTDRKKDGGREDEASKERKRMEGRRRERRLRKFGNEEDGRIERRGKERTDEGKMGFSRREG